MSKIKSNKQIKPGQNLKLFVHLELFQQICEHCSIFSKAFQGKPFCNLFVTTLFSLEKFSLTIQTVIEQEIRGYRPKPLNLQLNSILLVGTVVSFQRCTFVLCAPKKEDKIALAVDLPFYCEYCNLKAWTKGYETSSVSSC